MTRRKLVIERKVWLRGEGGERSYLLRSEDHKRCCVGIYLRALRVPDRRLKNRPSAAEVLGVLPDKAAWLLYKTGANSVESEGLYGINDNTHLPESQREREVAIRFAAHGVDVEFVG